MQKIKVLDKEIAELIAAGEVIERPSSVIKELVENSIDSGATNITVEIQNGGTTYMRVTDNGCGMDYYDVPTAFLRHATSKISDKDDLDSIYTLGFRGEALASAAAVSKIEVMTKCSGETYGTIYKIEGSEEKEYERAGCPDGTTIIVRDLFYNIPARRKFMKKDVTEANAVSRIIRKLALSRPDIAFRLIRDNRPELNSCGDGDLYSAIYAVYGRDFAGDMIHVEYNYEGVNVSGYAVKPLYAKPNRTFQDFFVNGHYVKSVICSTALESAFTNMIMTGKFPACVLMIDIAPSMIDVNIHPSKAEVRFTDEKKVSDAIYFAVKNALMRDGLLYEFEVKPPVDWTAEENTADDVKQQEIIFTPIDKIEEKEREIAAVHENDSPDLILTDLPTENVSEPVYEEKKELYTESEIHTSENFSAVRNIPVVEEIPQQENFKYIDSRILNEKPSPVVKPVVTETTEKKPEIRVIGEAFGNYIIAEIENTVVMIDKHAAHERIIFERLKSRNCRQYSQSLITGIRVLLAMNEIDALQSNTELLADMGFEFDFSESPYVVATAVPTFLTELNLDEIIPEIAENLSLGKQNPQTHLLDDMLHTIACKSAIKSHDKNDISELQSLAEQVYYDEKIRHCPHGRPVMFTMTKGNIEHQFKRT